MEKFLLSTLCKYLLLIRDTLMSIPTGCQILLQFEEQIGRESPTGWLSLPPENYNIPQVAFERGKNTDGSRQP